MPLGIVNDNGLLVFDIRNRIDNLVGFLGYLFIQFAPLFVVLVDALALLADYGAVFGQQQIHSFLPIHHPSGGIQARTDLEDDVADGDFLSAQTTYVNHALQSHARATVDLSQAIIRQNTVFPGDGHDVRCDTDSRQFQQPFDIRKREVVVHPECLHELKPYTTTRKMLIRIVRIRPFRIEDSHRIRQFVVGHVVVADNKIYPPLLGVGDFFDCLNATIQGDNQGYAMFLSVLNASERDTVALIVTIRDIIIQVRRIRAQILIDQRHSRRPIHVVVSINQYPFFVAQCLIQPLDRLLHVGHQKRIVQITEARPEESLYFLSRR